MTTGTVYITVRLDISGTGERITDEDIRQVVDDLDYAFISRTDGFEVYDTEICGIND